MAGLEAGLEGEGKGEKEEEEELCPRKSTSCTRKGRWGSSAKEYCKRSSSSSSSSSSRRSCSFKTRRTLRRVVATC